jgi:hypothetical protein
VVGATDEGDPLEALLERGAYGATHRGFPAGVLDHVGIVVGALVGLAYGGHRVRDRGELLEG